MSGSRSSALDSLVSFLDRDSPERTKVVLLQARHAVGLSEFLRLVSRRAKGATDGAIVDDVQREPNLEWVLGQVPRRMILGIDTEDADDLGVDPVTEIKSLRRRGAIEAVLENLPQLDDDEVAAEVLRRFPATHDRVAMAFARRLEGRIALVEQTLQLPEVRLRSRGDRIHMVPEQVARLNLAVEDLLDESWRTLGHAERRVVLVLARRGITPVEQLRRFCEALQVDADTALEQADGWVEIRGDVALPTKGARRLFISLIERQAPVALEVDEAVRGVSGQAASEPTELRTKTAPTEAPRSRKGGDTSGPRDRRGAVVGKTARQPPRQPPSIKRTGPTPASRPMHRPSSDVRSELERFRGPARTRAPAAQALSRELVASLQAEGNLQAAAKVQQGLVNALSSDLGDAHPDVATERLRLAEILAELGDPHAAGTFTRAIYALADVHGANSLEARSARQRRRRALPPRSD